MARTLPIGTAQLTTSCAAPAAPARRCSATARCRGDRKNRRAGSRAIDSYARLRAVVDIVTEADDGEHPAAGADQSPCGSRAVPAWTIMLPFRSAASSPVITPPVVGAAGIACRGEHHCYRRATAPLQLGMRSKITGGGGVQQAAERRHQAGQQRLGFGVAEPGVELDHPDTRPRSVPGRRTAVR